MIRYDTYIFDLDGTLLNTLNDLAASCNFALQKFGMPLRSVDEVRRFVGNGVRLLMERAVPGGALNPQFEQVLKAFREHYMLHQLDTTAPYPGVIDVLSALRREGRGMAVVSNKFYDATQALCRHFFGGIIDVAIGEREGIRKKPAPDTVVEAMRLLGARVDSSVYVGDSDVDIETARNAGLPCISVLWGFRSREFLLEHGATTLVAQPEDLLCI